MTKPPLFRRIAGRFSATAKPLSPIDAYDSWAAGYDAQPENVVFKVEAGLFTNLLARVAIEKKVVLDIGCGTGRHWAEILSRSPAELAGVDPSRGMLRRLKLRYPNARVWSAPGDAMPEVADASCDVIVSTLALAHMRMAAAAIREWQRMLKPGGAIVITDFHPDGIRAGMKRTFAAGGKTIEIEHHATDLEELRQIAAGCGLVCVFTEEAVIDESVRPVFERVNYLEAYEKYKGKPLVFGMHFVKVTSAEIPGR